MTSIKAIVRNRRIDLAAPFDWPDGAEVVIKLVSHSATPSGPKPEPITGMTEDDQGDGPESIARWLAEFKSIPPLQMTTEEQAAWEAARQAQREAMTACKNVTIFTRGISSPRGGGFGVLLLCEGHRKELSGGTDSASNNRMDLLAALEGLRALKNPCRVTLYNTNSYLTDGMSKGWAQRWQENGWRTGEGKPTAHADLWKELLAFRETHEVDFIWLAMDPRIVEYCRCDELARRAIVDLTRPDSQTSGSSIHPPPSTRSPS